MNNHKAKLLKVFVGESDKLFGRPLFEVIFFGAKKIGIAGVTVSKGFLSYGADSRVHSASLFAISDDLPVIIDIVDNEDKVSEFTEIVKKLFVKANCGGMMAVQDIELIQFFSTKQKHSL